MASFISQMNPTVTQRRNLKGPASSSVPEPGWRKPTELPV